ncbi:ABC transporter permease [Paenibacillus tyrfis]|uniref:carbohydrate ABC transporter permease n=1 Tax=Paenibacillus tyrfis TaxID=1501230 RepID=UPI002493577F|nr:sugar ABC transporter permease [Paenibacillus tyrfis]GLI05749.1 ABC transporter permease [Paenibacillus tyrfis]
MKKRTGDQAFGLFSVAPAIVLVFGIVLLPLIQTLLYSVQDRNLTSSGSGEFVGLSNYASVLGNPDVWSAFGRTAYFAAVSIVAELLLGTMIALLLNEKFAGVRFLRSVIILPWAVPTIVNGAMWKWIYHPEYGALNALLTQFHLIDAYRPWLSSPWTAMNMVILADVWKMTPFVAIFILASLQLTNKSVYEAANIDGAGLLRRFAVLTLPYLKSTFLFLIVMRTMETFKVFDLIFVLTQGGPANGTMVVNYMTYIKAFTSLQFSEGATLSYLIAAFIALLTFAYVKGFGTGEAKT